MRVRSNRQTTESRRRGGGLRRVHPRQDEPATTEAARPAPRDEDDLADERRLRASGGPDDRAQYSCGCGYVWETDVTASVTCPHCGAAQAW